MEEKITITKEHIASIRALAKCLEEVPRLGKEVDDPEGSRYIQISDTLAKEWAFVLRLIGRGEDAPGHRKIVPFN